MEKAGVLSLTSERTRGAPASANGARERGAYEGLSHGVSACPWLEARDRALEYRVVEGEEEQMTVQERRKKLLEWLRLGKPKTALEIVSYVDAYDVLGRDWTALVALCRADLRHLERRGLVRRLRGPDPEGRPHRWEAV